MDKLNRNTAEEDAVDVMEVWTFVKKHLLGIIAIVVACLILGSAYSYFETPTYRSSATMAVMYDGTANESTAGKYTFSANIASTFVLFLSENVVLDEVSHITGYPVSTLKSHLRVQNTDLIIKLSYEDESPEKAQAILAYIMDNAILIADSVDENGAPRYKMLNNNLKSFSTASVASKVSHRQQHLMIAGVLGILLAGLYVLIGMLRDKTFKSAADIESLLNMPVLSQIPYYVFDGGDTRNGEKN